MHLRNRLIVLGLALSLMPVFMVSRQFFLVQAQQSDTQKKINKRTFDFEPIQIVGIRTNNKDVTLDQVFSDEGEWLQGFSIDFRNVSNRTISYITIGIGFPDTEKSGKKVVHSIRYGVPQVAKVFEQSDVRSLAPNATDTIVMSPQSFSTLKTYLEMRGGLNDLKRAEIAIERVDFQDGSHWGAGDLWVPNPMDARSSLPKKPDWE